MGQAIYIDTSNMNVLFVKDNVICTALNYSACPDSLVMDMKALGNSFDLYYILWPRIKQEGDVQIPGLNFGNVEFWAIKEELRALITLSESIDGVNNVYFCNYLVNFLLFTRVSNFTTILCYGSRYVKIDTVDKQPVSLKIFDNQIEFYNSVGEDFSCYGDMDLIDVDSIRALHPELEGYKKTVIIPITALIASIKSPFKLSLEDLKKELALYIPEIPKVEEKVVQEPVVEEDVSEVIKTRRRVKIDVVTLFATVVTCAFSLILGYGYQFRDVDKVIDNYTASLGDYESELEYQNSIKDIYNKSFGFSGKMAEVLTYAKSSELEVIVTSVSCFNDRVVIQFSCISNDVKDKYCYYMERKYSLSGVSQYGVINNTDGTKTFEYGLTLLL